MVSRLVVAATVIDTLAGLNLKYPSVSEDQKLELAAARHELENE
jgi:hypothetical protein